MFKFVLDYTFGEINKKYIEVSESTPEMSTYARWIYGKHPTDEMIRDYINMEQCTFLKMTAK